MTATHERIPGSRGMWNQVEVIHAGAQAVLYHEVKNGERAGEPLSLPTKEFDFRYRPVPAQPKPGSRWSRKGYNPKAAWTAIGPSAATANVVVVESSDGYTTRFTLREFHADYEPDTEPLIRGEAPLYLNVHEDSQVTRRATIAVMPDGTWKEES